MATTRHDLFALDPNDFVAARDQLARELRANGEKDEAVEIRGLRRPSVSVWAINQMARTDPSAVEELIAATTDARAAQDAVLAGGDRDILRDALARRRQAMGDVAKAARRAIEGTGRSANAHEREIDTALSAIAASERLTEALRRGELAAITADDEDDRELLAMLGPPIEMAPTRDTRELNKAREQLERVLAEAAEVADRLVDAERELADAVRAQDDAERARERADAAVAQAAREVNRLET